MSKITDAEKKILLKEYEIGEKLRDSYFKNSWVVTSIILPISFGLVGFSYSEQILRLPSIALFPLMLASLSLYGFWYFYIFRYAGFLSTIFETLQTIEVRLELELETSLHRNIHNKDKHKGMLRMLNNVAGGLLIAVWVFRLVF